MRKVEFIMGMPIAVDIPSCDDEGVFGAVFNRLRQIDGRFSPYKKDSELSQYQRGELKEVKLSTEFKKVIQACQEAEESADGYFSAYFAGSYNPSGYVKGWAISEAGEVIEKEGFKTYCIGAGGDILARSDSDKVWNIGIQDPKDKQKILISVKPSWLDLSSEAAKISSSRERYKLSNKPMILHIKNGAVATSGSYERGNHIINPKTGKPADKFLSVTVTGPNIITADIFATAIFAAEDLKLIKVPKNYKTLLVS